MSTGNAVVDGLVTLAADKANEANALAERVSSARGNFAKSVKDARENGTDDYIVEYREWEEKVYAEINRRREAVDAKIAESLGGKSMTDDELKKAEADHKEILKAARAAWKAAQQTAEMFSVELADNAPELKTLAGRTTSVKGGSGSGGRRFRFDDVKINGESVGSLSKAAHKITSESGVKTTAKDLQDALRDQTKTDDPAKMNGVSLPYTATKDGKTFSFTVEVFHSAADAKADDAPEQNTEDDTEE